MYLVTVVFGSSSSRMEERAAVNGGNSGVSGSATLPMAAVKSPTSVATCAAALTPVALNRMLLIA